MCCVDYADWSGIDWNMSNGMFQAEGGRRKSVGRNVLGRMCHAECVT